jgi:hypothetical protein
MGERAIFRTQQAPRSFRVWSDIYGSDGHEEIVQRSSLNSATPFEIPKRSEGTWRDHGILWSNPEERYAEFLEALFASQQSRRINESGP